MIFIERSLDDVIELIAGPESKYFQFTCMFELRLGRRSLAVCYKSASKRKLKVGMVGVDGFCGLKGTQSVRRQSCLKKCDTLVVSILPALALGLLQMIQG